jgi:hemolysin activation/secretion protein
MSIGADGILHSSPTPNPEGSRPVAGSRFYKFNVDAGRYQKFIWNTFILLKGSAQMSASNLPIAEQMSIGGADSVRGYPESDFLGDYGFTGTAELRMPPPFISNWKDPITRRRVKEYAQILGFLDFGEVWIKHMEPGETKMNYIVGAGFGVRINVQEGLDFRMDIGFPVGGKEPSDGSKASTYVQAITKF